MDFKKIAKEVLKIEAEELLNSASQIGDEMGKVVKLISSIKGKLIITGVGKSGLIGAKISATLASTGTSSFFLHPTEALHGDLGMIDKNDAVLAISYSGESEELVNILPHIKRFEIPLIAMTSEKSSTLGRYSDIFLSIKIQKEACPLNTAPTSSTTLTLALGDAIAVCLMKNSNFAKEDFASFHPGGALGKKLFVKVKDLMRIENLPIANENIKLKDALIILSQGRVGNLILVDKKNRLTSILSDGDLRRAMMKKDFSLDSLAKQYATKNPKSISNNKLLASETLELIEKYKIQLLVITNRKRKVKGILHIHDLVEAGIK